MKLTTYWYFAPLATLLALTACAPVLVATGAATAVSYHDRRLTGVQADDEVMEWKARNRLPERLRTSAHLNFTAFNQVLLVTGEVPDASSRQVLGEVAGGIENVRQVFNEVQIGRVSTLGERTQDTLVGTRFRARLLESPAVSSNHIKAVTERGVVFLLGVVSQDEAEAAIRIARSTEGVKKVVNLLDVRPLEDIRRIDARSFGGTSPR